MRRLVLAAIALCVALVIAVGVYLAMSLDAIVAREIERVGTRVVGAQVRVGDVDLELSEGTGTIRGLRVSNPDGFGSDDAFELERIVLQLDPRSVIEPPLRLVRVEIEETNVRLEVDERGRSNLDEIVRHAREAPDEPEGEAGEARRIAIDRLHFAGGSVVVERPGADAPERLALPGFDRSGIGGARGATGGEIARIFTQALARQVAASAAGSEVQRAVEEKLGGRAGEAAGSVVRGLLGD